MSSEKSADCSNNQIITFTSHKNKCSCGLKHQQDGPECDSAARHVEVCVRRWIQFNKISPSPGHSSTLIIPLKSGTNVKLDLNSPLILTTGDMIYLKAESALTFIHKTIQLKLSNRREGKQCIPWHIESLDFLSILFTT